MVKFEDIPARLIAVVLIMAPFNMNSCVLTLISSERWSAVSLE